MANQPNASVLYDGYEYYLDYLDLIPVDERKLKANKYLIVIAFWVSLAVFVALLFLILLSMSWSGSSRARNRAQHRPTRAWSHGLKFPFCVRRHPMGSPELGPGAGQQSIPP